MVDSLLHSVAELWPVLEQLLLLSEAKSAVETGIHGGETTRLLINWAQGTVGEVTAIAPFPGSELLDLARSYPALKVVADFSPGALRTITDRDFFILDSDQNYYTVFHELKAIAQNNANPHIICIHDIGWPWGRRDAYANPEVVPPEWRNDYTYHDGITPDNAGTIKGGWRGSGVFAYARREGGARNGVLTAVEDFIIEQPTYELFKVMAIMGLGVLVHRDTPNFDAIRAFLIRFTENPLLSRLEMNRMGLYLRLIDAEDRYNERRGKDGAERTLQEQNRLLQERIAALEAKNAELWANLERIWNTRAWKLIQRWWAFKNTLLGRGKREK